MRAQPTSARLELAPASAERLRDSGLRILVTGASGWLGQASLEMIESALGDGFDRRVHAFASRARQMKLRSGRVVTVAPLDEMARLPRAPSLLLHYAFLTKDRVAHMAPDEYARAGEGIAQAVAAALDRLGVERMLFPSSGAVYGQPMRADRSLLEEPRDNPYGTQKLRDEARFSLLCRDRGVRLAIPRVFSLSGPFINKHDAYALASVINSALAGSPIEIRAKRQVLRSYLGVDDLVDVSLGWLLADSQPAKLVFDSGGSVVEIGELAVTALRVLRREDLPVQRAAPDGSPEDRYFGDGAPFAQLAAQMGVAPAPLDAQILATAGYLSQPTP